MEKGKKEGEEGLKEELEEWEGGEAYSGVDHCWLHLCSLGWLEFYFANYSSFHPVLRRNTATSTP